MLEAIEKLLILQDRDRKIARVEQELANIDPERQSLESRQSAANSQFEAVRNQSMQIESDRKKLELEVEGKKQQIEKYSLQQFQTKKNDEYRALAKEIDGCRAAIVQIEDQQLELMEQADLAQSKVQSASAALKEAKDIVAAQKAELATREESLKQQLAELQANHEQLTAGIDESLLARYERLRRHKGGSSLVGIEHSVCGGCHMKLPVQIVISCQSQKEIVSCPNCGRLLYYTPHMDLAVAD